MSEDKEKREGYIDSAEETDDDLLPSKRRSLVGEFVEYLGENKKWWMIPIICVILAMVVLMIFAAAGGAPFIYALF
ncbi:MAG: DUF5989 family protein [Candidatus Sumerlaeia bacterium]